MKAGRWLGWMVVALVAGVALAGAPEPVAGNVEAVTLYRGQALVTRSVPVDAPAGTVELAVSDLPEQVVADSLFAESGEGIEVRAVRLRTRAVGQAPREEVRQLEDQIQAAQDKLATNKKMQEVEARKLKFLDSLEQFTAPTAQVEMTKGVLNVETLTQLAQFSFEQRKTIADAVLKLATEEREITKQLAVLQRDLAALSRGASRTVREALVFLEKRDAAAATLKLSYLVSQAGWTPAYSFRTSRANQEIDVEYSAVIQQMSGEDWTGVALTLSTASPALSAQGPGLAPFRVALSKTPGQRVASQQELARQFRGSQERLAKAEQDQRGAQLLRSNRDFNWAMNAAANDFQGLELTVARDALEALYGEPGATAEVTSVTYKLAAPVSLASRSDQQMLRIADLKLPGKFYHVATPILTSYVYREAELTNNGIDALLAGPVSVYLDGRFMGRGEIPTVARGETFVMGLGADPQARARRELVTKKEGVQGGNREITINYRLVLENYKDEPVQVRLVDRYPISERDTDIRVTLLDLKTPLSEDPLYVRLEQPKGLLRWDVEVPARTGGDKPFTVEYSYKLEFDRSLHLTTPIAARAAELREEFERMQRKRSLR